MQNGYFYFISFVRRVPKHKQWKEIQELLKMKRLQVFWSETQLKFCGNRSINVGT